MGKKSYKMTEELARRVQRAFGSDAVTPASSFTADARHETSREFINCILHADISSTVQQVDCTRLVWLSDRGDQRAWQAVIDPTLTSRFSLVVNGTTIGPFTNSTTTTQFQTALNTVTNPTTPQGWVVHGNFLIYPATSVIKSGSNNDLAIYEVPWIPMIGDAWTTTVCARRLTKMPFRRGSTQTAEFIHGIGFAVASDTYQRLRVVLKEDLYAAVNTKRDPSYAEAWVLRRNANGDLTQTPEVIRIVNRFKNISVDAGVYAKAEMIDGEWELYAADCSDESDSSSSVAEDSAVGGAP